MFLSLGHRLDIDLVLLQHVAVCHRILNQVGHRRGNSIVAVGGESEETEHRRILCLTDEVGYERFEGVLSLVELNEVAQLGSLRVCHLGCAVRILTDNRAYLSRLVVTGYQHFMFLDIFHKLLLGGLLAPYLAPRLLNLSFLIFLRSLPSGLRELTKVLSMYS